MTPKQIRDAANSPWPLQTLRDADGPLCIVRPVGRTRDGRDIVLVAPDTAHAWAHTLREGQEVTRD